MTASRSSKLSLAIGVFALGLSACGSDEPAAGESLPEPNPSVTDKPVDTDTDPEPASDDLPEGVVLGTVELNGTIVEAKPHVIGSIDVQESFPEQLVVNFTGGDPNCTAAAAQAIAIDGQVVVSLEVGISEDALIRSCLAGVFDHALTIPLREELNGRPVVVAL